jgi:hypothetical protein
MKQAGKAYAPAPVPLDTGPIVDGPLGSFSKVAKIWHVLQGFSWSDQVTVSLRRLEKERITCHPLPLGGR